MITCRRLALAFLVCAAFAACHSEASSSTRSLGGRRRVAIRADKHGFTPSSVALVKGTPATLVFTRTTDDTCAKQVVFPELSVKKDLPLDKPVDVNVPTSATRTLNFACGMGMFKGSVTIQ
jgi:plastocyanin domain-containing protein